MSADRETWKTIPGYSFYEVSDLGRVRSYRNRWGRLDQPRVMSLKVWTSPASLTTYRMARVIGDDGTKGSARPVHLLVLAAFVGPRPEGMVTRHLNGDGSDNRLVNLQYGTPQENGRDRVAHGRHRGAAKTHCPKGHPYAGTNLYVRPDGRHRECRTCWGERRAKNSSQKVAA